MICWNRFISYIYRYHRNEKCENTGFAKVQKIAGNGRIQIGLKDILEKRDAIYLVYIYRETLSGTDADHETHPTDAAETVIPRLQFLGKLKMRGGRGEESFLFDWNNVMGSGRPMTAWNGIIIAQTDSEDAYPDSKDIFCSSWTDNKVDYSKAFEKDNAGMTDMPVYKDMPDISGQADTPDRSYIPDDSDSTGHFDYSGNPVDSGGSVDSGDPVDSGDSDDSGDVDVSGISEVLEAEDQTEIMDAEFVSGEAAAGDTAGDSSAEAMQEALVLASEEEKKDTSMYGNPAEEILATHEKLPLLPKYDSSGRSDAQVFECVKITPNDIGRLDMENWRLGINSFLTHGYYHYQYLMFGKVVFQEEEAPGAYILGVPGVYSSKEKYLADIFGFDRFVPCQETMVKTGSFGYWIVDIKN